jgi:DNA-binding transcriptional ArsR family regulator
LTVDAKMPDPDDVGPILRMLSSEPRRAIVSKVLEHPHSRFAPVEIAQGSGISLATVGYHVRVMEELGAVALIGEEPVRGSTKHWYRPSRLITDNLRFIDAMVNRLPEEDGPEGSADSD